MKAKNALVGIGMLAMVFGAVSGAQAVTLQQFLNAPDKAEQASKGNPSKGQIIGHIYKQYAHHYYGNKNTAHIGECMERTYKTPTSDGGNRLDSLVIGHLKGAAQGDVSKHTVEGIVQGVIEAECGASGTAKTEPVRPGGPG